MGRKAEGNWTVKNHPGQSCQAAKVALWQQGPRIFRCPSCREQINLKSIKRITIVQESQKAFQSHVLSTWVVHRDRHYARRNLLKKCSYAHVCFSDRTPEPLLICTGLANYVQIDTASRLAVKHDSEPMRVLCLGHRKPLLGLQSVWCSREGCRYRRSGSGRYSTTVVLHMCRHEMPCRESAAQAELARKHRPSDNPRQSSRIFPRRRGMWTPHPQEIQHSALRLQDRPSSNGPNLDRRHRHADLQIAIIAET